MSSDDAFPWPAENSSKQSITELLHNPRASKLELPDVSFDLSSKSLSLNSSPPSNLPTPCDINHFEPYLRKYAPLYAEFQRESRRAPPEPQPLHSVPSQFFDTDFSPVSSHHLLVLQEHHHALSQHPQLAQLRNQLITYQTTLEYHLKKQLDNQSAQLAQSISNIRTLRQTILKTSAALRETREKAATLIPAVTSPILAVQRLTQIQSNLNALKDALNRVHTVANAPSDVAILLDSGEYSAAIDTVANAKTALSHPHLSSLKALGPVRAQLAQSVELIDNALRQQFRLALVENNELTLNHVVSLVNRMGRLPLLSRYFMREIKDSLARELANVTSLHAAANHVKASGSRAVLLANIIHCGQNESESSPKHSRTEPPEAWKIQMREAHADIDELIANKVDSLLTGWSVHDALQERAFIVITPENELTAENCFDEFKAALRFGEEVRSLEELADAVEAMFFIEKKRNALRAKISEKQIAFMGAFHKAHVDSLTKTIQSDRWQEVRVAEPTMRLLTAVVGPSITVDPEKASGTTTTKKGRVEVSPGSIIVVDEEFKTVATGARYVRSMCAYSLLTEKSPTLRSEYGRRGNDFCRLFNSLVGKAILGAAALQWSALRSITARHLSLASRTISLAAALAKHVNSPLEKALTGSQVKLILPLVKRSEKDLRDHHAQLLAKILAIMMDRLEAHEKTLKSLPWNKQQEMERFEMPSMYAVTLAKEASVLHRILWSVLPKREVFDIFKRVCAAYGTHLTEAYGSLDGGEEWIRVRVANDVSCLHNRLKPLDVFKANPASFKPLSRLYIRFAKDFFDVAAKSKSVPKSTEDRKSGVLPPSTANLKQSVSVNHSKSSEPRNGEQIEQKKTTDGEFNSKLVTANDPKSSDSKSGGHIKQEKAKGVANTSKAGTGDGSRSSESKNGEQIDQRNAISSEKKSSPALTQFPSPSEKNSSSEKPDANDVTSRELAEQRSVEHRTLNDPSPHDTTTIQSTTENDENTSTGKLDPSEAPSRSEQDKRVNNTLIELENTPSAQNLPDVAKANSANAPMRDESMESETDTKRSKKTPRTDPSAVSATRAHLHHGTKLKSLKDDLQLSSNCESTGSSDTRAGEQSLDAEPVEKAGKIAHGRSDLSTSQHKPEEIQRLSVEKNPDNVQNKKSGKHASPSQNLSEAESTESRIKSIPDKSCGEVTHCKSEPETDTAQETEASNEEEAAEESERRDATAKAP